MKHLIFVYILLLISCDSIEKRNLSSSNVVTDTLFFKALQRSLPYKTYLPPNYRKADKFPIVYLLHGHGGHHDDWFNPIEGNAQFILDSLIHGKMIPPLVAVTLDAGNSWYVDSKEQMETAYITEFIPFVEEKYKVNTEKNSRIIVGNSAGGFGALRFSLLYPELFQSAILLSPAAYNPTPPIKSSSRKVEAFTKDNVFNDSLWLSYAYPKLFDESQYHEYPKLYLSTGGDDEYNIFKVISDLREFCITNNISQEVTVINGGHSWDVWKSCFTNDLVRIFNIK